MLTFALSKGRLADKILKMLKELNLCDITIDEDDRRLIIESEDKKYRFFLAKPSDVPTFVDSGVADLGVVGKDTILEENRDIAEVLDLGFGKCRMCVCGKVKDNTYLNKTTVNIATKYPVIAARYFESRHQNTNIIKLNGSVELGPIVKMSDAIVDIVETGDTLRENGLQVVEEICDISTRLVANKESLDLKRNEIYSFVGRLKEGIRC